MQQTGESDVVESGGSVPGKRKSSVGQRWLTAAIAIPIVLVFVWFGGWFAFAATLLVVVLGTLELHNMLLHAGYRPLIGISFALSVVFLIASMFPQQRLFLLEIGLGGSLLLSFPLLFFREKLEGAMIDWALTLAISIYLGWPMSFITLLRGYTPVSIHIGPAGILASLFSGTLLVFPRGVWWILTVFLGVWGFDGAAFFTGRYFGRHKLAPRISPAKSWEGVLGGLVLSITAALLLTVKPLGVPWYLAVFLGIVLGVAAVVGDLAESLIKRQTHVKDSGQIMPGHGGMLDRVDSVLFVLIVVYIFAHFLGM